MENTGYLIVKDGVVVDAIVADAEFASAYAAANGFVAVAKGGLAAGIGHKYHDGKFWRDVKDPVLCEGGMIHEGQTEACLGGEIVGYAETTHEEEITE